MSVKRYRHIGSRLIETIDPNDGELVKASDYDALVSVCRDVIGALENLRKAVNADGKNPDVKSWGQLHIDKALALLDGEKKPAN